MKRQILASVGILLGACTTLFAQSPQELFNQALVQERAAGNLEQAAQLFQQVARASSDDRSLAAQGLMGAARSYQKLGQADQSKRLYEEVIHSYADQKDQVALARQYMADTGVVQGRVVRAGTSEPVPEAKVWLSDGPVDPTAFATLQAFFRSRRVEITFPPNGTIDEKYIQNVRDTAAAQGVSFGNPGVQAAIAQFQSANDSRFHATADSQGNFTIRNVLPGKYSISSEREGYFSASADSSAGNEVSVAPGKAAVVEMPMTRGATISGRVTDGAGQPLTNTTVIAYSVVYRNGFPLLVPAVAKTTDDRGEYRLAWLTGGEYLISVKPDVSPEIAMSTSTAGVPPVDGGLPTPKTYYPGTTDAANAIPVFVRGESPISGIDIQARKVETFHVKGTIRSHVPRATTYITGNFSIGSRSTNNPGDPSATVMDARMDKVGDDYVGVFDIKGVPTGTYTLSAWAREQNPDGGSQLAFALANLDVSNNDVTGLVLDIYPTVRVNGSVVVNGTAPGPVQARISVLVDSRNASGGVYQGLSQRAVLADGQTGAFMIPAVQTGHFHALVGGLPPDYYVADIRQGGVSVFDSGFDVGKESPSPIQVVINSGARSVEGTVRDSMGKPVAGATAVLVPPRERRQNRALYFTAKSDATGHFKIQGVAPGNYSLFSWQNMPDGAYYNDRFVSRNEDAARKVNVVQTSTTGADILLIPPIGR